MKIFNDTVGNRTRDLPDFSAVPQPSASPRASGTTAVSAGGGVRSSSSSVSSSSSRINTYFSVYFQTLLQLSKIAHI
jgi:hypothetical protein